MNINNNAKLILTAVIGLLSTGCTVVHTVEPETGHYYIAPNSKPQQIGKVALLELQNPTTTRQTSMIITEEIRQAMQKRHLFAVKTVSQDDPAWRSLDLDIGKNYTLEQMQAIRERFNVDAVMFGRITQTNSYPHMLMGLHLRMLDLREGHLLWAIEQLWDSTDLKTEMRMRAYYQQHMTDIYQPMDWKILMTSPRAFRKFVGFEVAQTMPQTNGYQNRLSSGNNGDNKPKETLWQKTKKIPTQTLKFADEVTTINM